ncbi:hypothetical protein FAI40_04160 [Acetobacteraceae bacterium]|nr:hypothetical protein FAI40_04160 [Acetobacteraceae bacterium]
MTLLVLLSLPILVIIYLCLNQKHKKMVREVLKKAFSWLMILRRKRQLEDGDSRKEDLQKQQDAKKQEVIDKAKENIEKFRQE